MSRRKTEESGSKIVCISDARASKPGSDNGSRRQKGGSASKFDMDMVLWLYRSGVEINRKKAIEMIYVQYRKYVISLARGYFKAFFVEGEKTVSMDDFISSGSVGLIEALDHFDPRKGAFTTCCKPYVLKHMTEQACIGSGIPTPHYMKVQKKLKHAIDAFRKRNAVPSVEQLVEATGLTERIVRDGLEMMRMLPVIPAGLCDYYSDDSDMTREPVDWSDTPEEIVLKQEFKTRMDDVIGKKLEIHEGEALRLRFGFYRNIPEEGLTFRAIADRLGVSDQRARSIVKKALRSLGNDDEVKDLAGKLLSGERKEEYPLDAVLPVYTEKSRKPVVETDPIGDELSRLFDLDPDTLLA